MAPFGESPCLFFQDTGRAARRLERRDVCYHEHAQPDSIHWLNRFRTPSRWLEVTERHERAPCQGKLRHWNSLFSRLHPPECPVKPLESIVVGFVRSPLGIAVDEARRPGTTERSLRGGSEVRTAVAASGACGHDASRPIESCRSLDIVGSPPEWRIHREELYDELLHGEPAGGASCSRCTD